MELSEKKNYKDSIANFIQKYRMAFFALIALIFIGIITAIVLEVVTSNQVTAITQSIEELDASFETLTKSDADKEKNQKAFDEQVQIAQQKLKGTYAEQRAQYLVGKLKYQNKDFAGAEADFFKAYSIANGSFFAPNALFNAAIAAEEAANIAKAKEYLNLLIKNYEKTSPLSIRAYFNLGRLAETEKKWAEAKDAYTKVTANYPDSDWTKLARDRIIFLKAQGSI